MKTPNPPHPDAAPVPEVQGSLEAYNRHIAAANALSAAEVLPMRGDPSLAWHNIFQGVTTVSARKDQIQRELPTVDPAFLGDLPDLALAVAFAARRVDRRVASPGTTHQLLSAGRSLRAILMASADAVAAKGLVPHAVVDRIHLGRGAIDMANDLLDLAALFQSYPDAMARTPLQKTDLDRAMELGKELLAVLKPENAPKEPNDAAELKAAVDARNRLWTLLVRGHDLLQRVGCWLFGPVEFSREVPSLHAHTGVRPTRAEKVAVHTAERDAARAVKEKAKADRAAKEADRKAGKKGPPPPPQK